MSKTKKNQTSALPTGDIILDDDGETITQVVSVIRKHQVLARNYPTALSVVFGIDGDLPTFCPINWNGYDVYLAEYLWYTNPANIITYE